MINLKLGVFLFSSQIPNIGMIKSKKLTFINSIWNLMHKAHNPPTTKTHYLYNNLIACHVSVFYNFSYTFVLKRFLLSKLFYLFCSFKIKYRTSLFIKKKLLHLHSSILHLFSSYTIYSVHVNGLIKIHCFLFIFTNHFNFSPS